MGGLEETINRGINNFTPRLKISKSALDNLILGGIRYKGVLGSSSDLNDKQVGYYICNTANNGLPSNIPRDLNTSFLYIGIGEGTTWGAQIIITTSSDTAMYVRSYVSSTFRDWKKLMLQS